MLKFLKYFRNKYILTFSIFFVYVLFLDDADIFAIFRQERKLKKLHIEKEEVESKLRETQNTLENLNSMEEIEKFAREQKLFKRHDEDIFVIVED